MVLRFSKSSVFEVVCWLDPTPNFIWKTEQRTPRALPIKCKGSVLYKPHFKANLFICNSDQVFSLFLDYFRLQKVIHYIFVKLVSSSPLLISWNALFQEYSSLCKGEGHEKAWWPLGRTTNSSQVNFDVFQFTTVHFILFLYTVI